MAVSFVDLQPLKKKQAELELEVIELKKKVFNLEAATSKYEIMVRDLLKSLKELPRHS